MSAARDRLCCDGLCQQGRDCPVLQYRRRPSACAAPALQLAPGVVDGPHRPPLPTYQRWFLRLFSAKEPRP
ncbi:hypothetical protein PEC18_12185 [Paucibacter sp. O1-1]|nr:hypothetical protein [Paucibacter sp. O1-1]MDA3826575.1 hypothetical protein [Paucibacter sp. O1-1]